MTHPPASEEEEQNLLDIAETDLKSAKYARSILKQKYGHEEDDLP